MESSACLGLRERRVERAREDGHAALARRVHVALDLPLEHHARDGHARLDARAEDLAHADVVHVELVPSLLALQAAHYAHNA